MRKPRRLPGPHGGEATMHILNHHLRANNEYARLRSLLAAILFMAVSLSGCKKPAPRTAPASAAASPAVSNQSSERTPDEIALINAAIKGDTAAVKALLDR